MKKELLNKLQKLTLCDECGISIPQEEYIILKKVKTVYRDNAINCEYKSERKLCMKCGEKEWLSY